MISLLLLLLLLLLLICILTYNSEYFENEIWNDTDLDDKDIFFVQIGSNCGTNECATWGDPIWDDCKKSNWSGIVVEPMPNTYNKLKQNYSYNKNVKAINCAISDKDGIQKIYGPDGAESSSLMKSHAEKHHLDKRRNYEEIMVKTYKLETFWNKFVDSKKVDILNLDCEGSDHIIILSTDFSKLTPPPKYILYESIHIPKNQKTDVLEHLKKYNYNFVKYGPKRVDTLVHNQQ